MQDYFSLINFKVNFSEPLDTSNLLKVEEEISLGLDNISVKANDGETESLCSSEKSESFNSDNMEESKSENKRKRAFVKRWGKEDDKTLFIVLNRECKKVGIDLSTFLNKSDLTPLQHTILDEIRGEVQWRGENHALVQRIRK